jgi:O-phosphoseryl-tRNA(Cys) synthetase
MHYIIEDNEYVLVDELDRVQWRGPEIAIALEFCPNDPMPGLLLKYGSPEGVEKWVAKVREKFLAHGYTDMANEIIVVKGKIPIEELSKIVDTSGYVGKWYQKTLKEVTR